MDQTRALDLSMRTNKYCQICDDEFYQMSLEVHIATVHPNTNKQHICEICKKVFKAENLLKVHFSAVHDSKNKRPFVQNVSCKDDIITCNICTEKFKQVHKWYLFKHVKTFHEGHKYYKCESCGIFFLKQEV